MFAKKFFSWNASDWKSNLQAVGDFKDFTWYPRELKPRFNKLRAPWTYMAKAKRRNQPLLEQSVGSRRVSIRRLKSRRCLVL